MEKTHAAQLKQWRLWVETGSVRAATEEELANLTKEANVLQMRWLISDKKAATRGNRTYEEVPAEMKARIIVPGYLDKDAHEGKLDTESPTLPEEAMRMILLIAVSMRWRVAQGDIDGAYHRGYELKRLIYFKAPVGGLPATDSMPEFAAGDLLVAQRSVPGLNDAGRQWYYTHRDGIIETGSHLSALAPTLFWWFRDGRTCGVLGTHVDDDLMAGDDQWHAEVVPQLQQLFPYGKWHDATRDGPFVHTGRTIHVTPQKVIITQRDYTAALRRIYLPRTDTLAKPRPITASERTALRACQGKVDWIARGTNPFIAYPLAKSRQCMPKDDTTLIHEINRIVSGTVLDIDVAYNIYPVDLYSAEFKVIAHGDSGFRNAGVDNNSTQAGYVIGVAIDRGNGLLQPYTVLAWKTHKLRRTVRSTLAAETMALSEAMEMSEVVRAYFLEFRNAIRLPVRTEYVRDIEIIGITDCRDLYDCVSGLGRRPTEVRLVMDIEALREYQNVQYRWVATTQQLADCLTKAGVDWYFRWVMEYAEVMYMEDPDLASKVLNIKNVVQQKRERAKAKHTAPTFKPDEIAHITTVTDERTHITVVHNATVAAATIAGACSACAVLSMAYCCNKCGRSRVLLDRVISAPTEDPSANSSLAAPLLTQEQTEGTPVAPLPEAPLAKTAKRLPAKKASAPQATLAASATAPAQTTAHEPAEGASPAELRPQIRYEVWPTKPRAPPAPKKAAAKAATDLSPVTTAPKPKPKVGRPCPKCGGGMQYKAAHRGGHFWGCAVWPQCNGSRRPHDFTHDDD